MAIYKCSICGKIFDEEKEGKKFSELTDCPVCHQPLSVFERIDAEPEAQPVQAAAPANPANDLAYDEQYARRDSSARYMAEIHEMAVSGKSIGGSMGTQMPLPSWDDILLIGAQLARLPLNDNDPVDTQTVIGRHAKKPLVLENPVYISHMSFGALSREIKVALAKGSAMAKTAMCSGEGGILPEEQAAAYKYIFEYSGRL